MTKQMIKPADRSVEKTVDSIQQRLTDYASALKYEDLTQEAIHAAKVRIIDTLGTVIGGYSGEPSRICRSLASQMPDPGGATIIGTRMKTAPDMAAFVNATTARDVEMSDTYHWPGSAHGHACDVVTPLLAVAEHVRASGPEFITSIILGYEVYLRFSTIFDNMVFDPTNFSVIGTAVGAGKLMALSPAQLSHGISLAVVPNVILRQMRKDHLSMFKAAASGQAGRAGVFAARLAQAGMEGPHLPFEGAAGWCDNVARKRFSFDIMGGRGAPFKILDTRLKSRASEGNCISHILAAEKVAPLKNIEDVKEVIVEVHRHALQETASGWHHWNPESRETADHSAPYVVAATLIDGTVTPRSYDDKHLWNSDLRELMQKIVVVENKAFTKAYDYLPVEHRTRVTVVTSSGDRMVGEAGGDEDDLSAEMSDEKVMTKFRGLAGEFLTAERIDNILNDLWSLEIMDDVSLVPSYFVMD